VDGRGWWEVGANEGLAVVGSLVGANEGRAVVGWLVVGASEQRRAVVSSLVGDREDFAVAGSWWGGGVASCDD